MEYDAHQPAARVMDFSLYWSYGIDERKVSVFNDNIKMLLVSKNITTNALDPVRDLQASAEDDIVRLIVTNQSVL